MEESLLAFSFRAITFHSNHRVENPGEEERRGGGVYDFVLHDAFEKRGGVIQVTCNILLQLLNQSLFFSSFFSELFIGAMSKILPGFKLINQLALSVITSIIYCTTHLLHQMWPGIVAEAASCSAFCFVIITLWSKDTRCFFFLSSRCSRGASCALSPVHLIPALTADWF